MSRGIAVLRPDPGNRVTAAAIEARGRSAIRLPLFAARPVAWEAPDPEAHDALLLTSANAVRHAGDGLAVLLKLPVHAVGEATAEIARRHGFEVVATGETGATALAEAAAAMGVRRALHLGGAERTLDAGGIVARAITVYASEPLPIPAAEVMALGGTVALVHSARAGARLAELVDAQGLDRREISIAAISKRAADAVGTGWRVVIVPGEVRDDALIDAAIALAD